MNEEQEQPDDREMSTYYSNNNKDAEIVKFLLEQEAEIQRKIMYYQGYDFDFKRQQYVLNPNRKKMLNKDGIEFVSRAFRRFLNKNSATANINFDQLSEMVICFSSSVRVNLVENMQKYEIGHILVVDEVKNDITDMAFLILTQSIDDKGRYFIHQGRRMVEHRALQTGEKAKSKLGFW